MTNVALSHLIDAVERLATRYPFRDETEYRALHDALNAARSANSEESPATEVADNDATK